MSSTYGTATTPSPSTTASAGQTPTPSRTAAVPIGVYVELLVAGGGLTALTTTSLGFTLLRSTTNVVSTALLDAYEPGGAEPSFNRSALWASFRTITEYNTSSSIRDLATRFTNTKSGVVNTTKVTGAGTQTSQWNAGRRRQLADAAPGISGGVILASAVSDDLTAVRRQRDLQSGTSAASSANLTRIVLYVTPPPSALATAGILLGDTSTVVTLISSSFSVWASHPDGTFLSEWATSTGVPNAYVLLGAVGAAVIIPPPPPPPTPPFPMALVVGTAVGSLVSFLLCSAGVMILASAARRAYREDRDLRGAERAAHDAIVGRPQHSQRSHDMAAQARSAATHGCSFFAAALATGGDYLFPRASAACFRVCFGGHRPKPPAPTPNHDIYADDDGGAFVNPVLDHASVRFHEAADEFVKSTANVDTAKADAAKVDAAKADVPHIPLGSKFSALLIRHPPHKAPPELEVPQSDPLPPRPRSVLQRSESAVLDLTPAVVHDALGGTDLANSTSPTGGAVAAVRRGYAAQGVADSLAHTKAFSVNDSTPSPPAPASPRVSVVRFATANARTVLSVDGDDNNAIIDTGYQRRSPRTSEGGRQLRFAAPVNRPRPVGIMGSLPETPYSSFADDAGRAYQENSQLAAELQGLRAAQNRVTAYGSPSRPRPAASPTRSPMRPTTLGSPR